MYYIPILCVSSLMDYYIFNCGMYIYKIDMRCHCANDAFSQLLARK
jgi:hypothetical protein